MNAMPEFQRFQRDFGLYLRDPRQAPRPQGVPARRAGVYRELLFNNVCGVIDACFPVSRKLFGERRWRRLLKRFFSDWRSQSPLFCDLPREFLRWLSDVTGEEQLPIALPGWSQELAHYEWAELAVDIMQTKPLPALIGEGDLLDGKPLVAPAHMLLAYQWPVHKISLEFRPRKPAPVQLVVFRDQEDKVQFVEINSVTARLLTLLAEGLKRSEPMSGREACLQVAAELQHPNPQAVVAGGASMLNDLRNWGVVYGVVA
jgi:uncharacterized protein